VLEADEGRVAAISSLELTLDRGEVLGLVGESGAGKTMVARAITGLLPESAAAQGEVLFNGRNVLTMTERELHRHRGAGAALCFQTPRAAIAPTRRVGHQVEDRLRAHRVFTRTPRSLFEEVGIRSPARWLRAYAHELSGGMAQRTMISLALACAPALLVADEPTTGLDVTLTRGILALLRRTATDEDRAVLIISHDLAAIAEVCDRVAVLYAGVLVEEGPARAVLRRPAHPYTAALLEAAPDVSGAPVSAIGGTMPTLTEAPRACPFAPRCPLSIADCVAERPALRAPAPGRRVACVRAEEVLGRGTALPTSLHVAAAPNRDTSGAPLLELSSIEVVYGARFGRGGFRALRGVDLSLDRGEALGIVGESGCGKSTLGRVALGLVRPSSGLVRFDGLELQRLRDRDLRRLRRRMQMVFQDPFDTLNPRRTVAQTLEDSLRPLDLPRAAVSDRIDAALRRVGLEPALRGRRRSELSGGQAQRVGIARALVPDPELVVFDEPTSALDATVQAQILDLVASLMRERSRSYLFISHDLATIRAVCDRVVVLYLGKVVEEGAVERVFERPLHPYTRALLSSAPSLRGTRLGEPVELRRDLDDIDAVEGCQLAPRCPFAEEPCWKEEQRLIEYEPGHRAACWRVPEIDRAAATKQPTGAAR
jgi:peptide/nickel transport system ATP-binding protein